MFNRCYWINQVDSLLYTARYTLFRAASWKQPAEGCTGSDHGGTAAVHAAGGALWHAASGATWPAQVQARPSTATPNAHMWDLWIPTVLLSLWYTLLLSLPGSITSMQGRLRWPPAWRSSSPVKRTPSMSSWNWWRYMDRKCWTTCTAFCKFKC